MGGGGDDMDGFYAAKGEGGDGMDVAMEDAEVSGKVVIKDEDVKAALRKEGGGWQGPRIDEDDDDDDDEPSDMDDDDDGDDDYVG